MRNCILTVLLSFAMLPVFGLPQRVVEVSGKTEKIRDLEIVVEKPSPLLDFAAAELSGFLKKGTGIQVPVAAKPSAGKFSIVLGDCASSRAAGIDVNQLPEEGYYIIRKGNSLFLAGRDDVEKSPMQKRWQQTYKRGTLSGVYDFLERFADARFYFPGAYGTIIPNRGALYLPEKIRIMERPDMSYRNYSSSVRTVYYPGYKEEKRPDGDALTRVRLRFSEALIQFGHGLTRLELIRRFGETHPEYFALMTDGRRCKERDVQHTGQLCFNSGIRQEIFLDAKAYLTHQNPSVRGLTRWHYNVGGKGFFNMMTQDWMYWCGCEKCREIAEAGRSTIYSDPKQRQAVSNFMWAFTAEMANRLKKEGIRGGVAQMAYPPYDLIPKCEIPDNVRIQVAVAAPGADKKDLAKIRKWHEKTGRRVTVWNYSIGKHMRKKLPGIPPMLPHGIGDFINANKEMIDGGYFESQSDYLLFQYLNYYILGKKLWNNSLDTEKLLADHYSVMFGKGAPMMKKFYEALEEAWGKKILGNTVDTGLGPMSMIPSDYQIWTQIYPSERMKEFNDFFDSALKAAAADKAAVGRIKFIRKHLFGPLEAEAKKFSSAQTSLDSWIVTCPGTVWLRPCKGEVNEVSTRVSISKNNDALVFEVDCEEPRMSDLSAVHFNRDDPETYKDSDVEIMLNPSGDRKNYYQFVVNANGALADYRRTAGGRPDITWNSSASAEAVKRADGWSVTLKVPLKELGETNSGAFPVNFCRNRNLKGKQPRENSYFWSPVSGGRGGFHAIENWGRLVFKREEKPLFQTDFTGKKLPGCWLSGGINGGQTCGVDRRIFISGGGSLHLKNIGGMRMGMVFYVPEMKPDTKYRLSCFMKTGNLAGRGGAHVSVNFSKKKRLQLPKRRLSGTTSWHRLSLDFVSPPETGMEHKPFVSCGIFNAGGDAWFDQLEIREIKP